MPQTTGAVPQSCARIDVATDSACSSWTNISGSVNSISGTEQSKVIADEYTFDGAGAISEVGKFEPFDMVVRSVFTNVVTEAYRIAREAFMAGACDGKICLRWIPSGAVGGDGMQTNYAPIVTFQWPPVDAAAGGPVMVEYTLHVSTIDPFVFVS